MKSRRPPSSGKPDFAQVAHRRGEVELAVEPRFDRVLIGGGDIGEMIGHERADVARREFGEQRIGSSRRAARFKRQRTRRPQIAAAATQPRNVNATSGGQKSSPLALPKLLARQRCGSRRATPAGAENRSASFCKAPRSVAKMAQGVRSSAGNRRGARRLASVFAASSSPS